MLFILKVDALKLPIVRFLEPSFKLNLLASMENIGKLDKSFTSNSCRSEAGYICQPA